jgi:hypothetical protein
VQLASGAGNVQLVFSPPVLIEGVAGKEQSADGFGSIEVDPAGERTLLYGAGYWTSYDSGKTWASTPAKVLLPAGMGGLPPDTSGYDGQDGGGFGAVVGGGAGGASSSVHNLGSIMHCPPNGCWTDNHTKSSCNNASAWVAARNPSWAGCRTAPPAPLSQRWLSSAAAVGYFYKNRTDGLLWSSAECKGVVFHGLPQNLSSNWGMCDGFTQPSRVELADGSVLVTFPLVFAGERPPMGCGDAGNSKCGRPANHSAIVNHLPMSLVVFRSTDSGFTFDFMAVAANYSQIPGSPPGAAFRLNHSAYGPQENAMALLADNKTVMIAFRPDTDSMCPGGPIPYKYYYQVYSEDGGRHWSAPTPIHGVGCVRPRMLRLPGAGGGGGGGPLLMTGGRLCPDLVPNSSFAGHGCLPQRGNGQGGIFVWLNADGMADAPIGTAKGGSEWQTFCLGAIHNEGIRAAGLPAKYLFLNATKPEDVAQGNGQSQTYNSLVPLGADAVGVVYQLGYSGPTASTWMMRIDVKRIATAAATAAATVAATAAATAAPG